MAKKWRLKQTYNSPRTLSVLADTILEEHCGMVWLGGCSYVPKTCPDWFEPVVERWTPESGECYWFPSVQLGCVVEGISRYGQPFECFRTREYAEEATKRIKAALDKYHEEIGE